jgi:hypothetical protein
MPSGGSSANDGSGNQDRPFRGWGRFPTRGARAAGQAGANHAHQPQGAVRRRVHWPALSGRLDHRCAQPAALYSQGAVRALQRRPEGGDGRAEQAAVQLRGPERPAGAAASGAGANGTWTGSSNPVWSRSCDGARSSRTRARRTPGNPGARVRRLLPAAIEGRAPPRRRNRGQGHRRGQDHNRGTRPASSPSSSRDRRRRSTIRMGCRPWPRPTR